jgi:hypothetical protein
VGTADAGVAVATGVGVGLGGKGVDVAVGLGVALGVGVAETSAGIVDVGSSIGFPATGVRVGDAVGFAGVVWVGVGGKLVGDWVGEGSGMGDGVMTAAAWASFELVAAA